VHKRQRRPGFTGIGIGAGYKIAFLHSPLLNFLLTR
jgi:hypothetical protein